MFIPLFASCIGFFIVLLPGLEPGTTDPKSVMISISPQERYSLLAPIDSTPELGERLLTY
jgi:hypothetical protein